MKIRTNFVSNSSSTSFIIAVSEVADVKDHLILEMFEKTFPGWDDENLCPKIIRDGIESFIDQMENQIDELNKDLVFAKSERTKVASLLQDEKLLLALSAYRDAVQETPLMSRRMCRSGVNISAKELFEREIYMFDNAITRREQKIAELKKELDLVKGVRENKNLKYIMKLDVDHGFDGGNLIRQIEIMEKACIVTIIKKRVT